MIVRARAAQLNWSHEMVKNLCLSTTGAIALALLAQVKIPLGFTPVPITLQVMAVLALGGFLGPSLAVAAVLEYLLFGICGLPVFSNCASGFGYCLGATGGYLLAFAPAAALFGGIYRWAPAKSYVGRLVIAFAAGTAAVAVIYLLGCAWLAIILHLGWTKACILGVKPFLAIDLAKMAIVAAALAVYQPHFRRS